MDALSAHTLPKCERLCGTAAFSKLVRQGRYGSEGCLKYCILSPNGLEYSRMAVSVSKKLFRRAVKRNLLKRRIRESYRLQKDILGAGKDVLFIYTGKEIRTFEEISSAMEKILVKNSGHDGKDC